MYYMLHIKPHGGYSIWIDDPRRKGYLQRYKTVTKSAADELYDELYADSMEKRFLERHIVSKCTSLKNFRI